MEHVCPWWLAYTFDNPVRRIIHDPARLLSPWVKNGMTVLDVGCGMGHFSIGMARLVGESGKVIAADVQEEMLTITMKRATKADVASRIRPHRASADRIGIDETVDFALASWMLHEVVDAERFLREVHALLKPGGHFLVMEPAFHVWRTEFRQEARMARDVGFRPAGDPSPRIRFSHSELFRKDPG